MTVMLEVAIGLVFVYLVISLLASAIAEVIEHVFHYRADYLRQGVEKLLLDGHEGLQKTVFNHPLIKSLYTKSKLESKFCGPEAPHISPSASSPLRCSTSSLTGRCRWRTRSSDPRPPQKGRLGAAGMPSANAVSQLLAEVNQNQTLPPGVKGALRTLISDAGDDMENVKANVEQWFDGSIDRVGGG